MIEDELELEDNDAASDLELEDNGAPETQMDDLQLETNAEETESLQLEQNANEHDGSTQSEDASLLPAPQAALPLGQRIVIAGLISKPEFNGKLGTIKSFSTETGRYGVRVDDHGVLLSLKPANLERTAAPLKAKLEAEARAKFENAQRGGVLQKESDGNTDQGVLDFAARHGEALRLREEGRAAEAASMLGELLSQARRALGREHPETLAITNNLSALLQSAGKLAEAAPLCHEVVERRRAILGPGDPATINALINLGSLYLMQGEARKAAQVRREVCERRREIDGKNDPSTLAAMDMLATALLDVDAGEGGKELEEALELKTEELNAHLARHGKAECAAKLPAESKATTLKAFNACVKQPDVGKFVKGHGAFVTAVKAALSVGGS